jgi:signal transduction histidine kinase
MFFKSIKQEILTLTLGLTILTIIVTTGLGIFSTQNAGGNAERVTSLTLRDQAKESLVQIAESAAERQDLLFSQIKDDASNITSYTQNIYTNPTAFPNTSYWKFDSHVTPKDGLLLSNDNDASTFHIPNFVKLDAAEKKNIELSANLDFIAPNLIAGNKNIAAIYIIDNKGATARYYPNVGGGGLANLAPPDYDPKEDIYYKPVSPKEDPEKKILWSVLYDDRAGLGSMITVMSPIYVKDQFWGMTGIDVFLSDISKTISEYKPIEGSYALLLDKEGNTIAFPDKAYADLLIGVKKEQKERINLVAGASPEFGVVLKEMMKGSKGFGTVNKDGKELFVAYAPLKQTEFSLAIVAEAPVMLKAATDLSSEISGSVGKTVTTTVLPISLIIILIASIISVLLVTRIVKPVRKLTEGAHEIGGGNLDFNIEVESKNEIGELAGSFNQMSKSLKKSREDIEKAYEVEKKAHKTLEALGKAKSEFIMTAAHQLRTPLTEMRWLIDSMTGKTEMLTQRGELHKLWLSTGHVIEIVNDLLNATEVEGGEFGYSFKKVDMVYLIEDIMKESSLIIKNKHIEFVFTPTERPLEVFGDQVKLGIVLRNIIQNAVDYSREQGKVDITLEKINGKAVFSVHDNGIGMSPEDQQKVFTKFYRSDDARKMETDRSGLGLYIVKGIIEKHKGDFKISSEVGVGTTVTVSIPCGEKS